MGPNDVLTALVRTYALGRDSSLLNAAQESVASPALPAVEVGQQIAVTVIAQTEPGMIRAQWGTQVLQLNLPGQFTVGQGITLRVVSTTPRLTFSLVTSEQTPSAFSQLSGTAQLLSELTQQPTLREPVVARQPLIVDASPAEPPALMSALQQALQGSGLFYESQQAQWVQGSTSLEQLRQQPQNQPPPSPQGLPGGGAGVANTASASAAAPLPVIPAHLQSLVQQQLHLLENGQWAWQGYLSPEIPLRWALWPDNGGSGTASSQGAEPSSNWVTTLELQLPQLGSVMARLNLASQGLGLTLSAPQEETRALMGAHGEQLRQSLEAQGLMLTSLAVTP